MEYEAIIFDCDGTLADTMPLHYEAWSATLATVELTLDEDRFYAMGGWPTTKVAQWIRTTTGVEFDIESLIHRKEEQFLENLLHVTAIAPVADVVRRHQGSLPLAVATGSTRAICEMVLQHIGLGDSFQAIVTCDDVATHKPDPAIYLRAAELLKVPPTRCLVYEDTDPGVEAAHRAGMACIDVRDFYRPRRVTQQ